MDFREASEIAKKNPGAVMTRDSTGSFIVRLDDGRVIGTENDGRTAHDESFREELTGLRDQLIEKNLIIEKLETEIKALRDNIEAAISTRLDSEKSELANIRKELSLQRSVFDKKTNDVQARLQKLDLLEKTYRERFGEVEIKTVKESVESRSVCQRCGGDGGVRGGCQKCDGSGWVLSTETTFREVGEIK
ncbi:MAG: hypothetical protein LBF51_10740 [Zoogloeaceae bacterium]|jgi:predicted RNase H-like nuclease (RuvC/YqgF family)|nr:hypothetical protein [Zoogloeaceae bacterium]